LFSLEYYISNPPSLSSQIRFYLPKSFITFSYFYELILEFFPILHEGEFEVFVTSYVWRLSNSRIDS